MTPEHWHKVKQIFQAALEQALDDRQSWLREACRDDEQVRCAVEEMLAAHDASNDFLENPGEDFSPLVSDMAQREDPLIGKRIGAYRIEEVVGEGGMGIVYRGVRDDETFNRKVAIKLIRHGLDSKSIMRRFQQERQTLAVLDHPNIARLIDGGSTEDGLPYFIMEYIDGLPLGIYCDTHHLTINQRLDLFLKVCAAVSFAHQNLVIHRDLKPGNILVTNSGEPKLLDFGIAKLLHTDPGAQTVELTVGGSHFVTPEYCSPEQIRDLQITTASDVYSLGALLYSILTGSRVHEFKTRSPLEIERVICEEDAPRPSSMVVDTGKTRGSHSAGEPSPVEISRLRGSTPEKLRKKLSGDLDNILLMALRKEPQRRYASVQQLSEDIQRFLDGRPVAAHQESFPYIAGKFIRRHRSSVAAAVFILLLLIGGVVAVSWQANIAARERDKAQLEAVKAQRINRFFQDMLAAANPRWYGKGEKRGPDVTVVQVLREASARLESDMSDLPEVRAELHLTIGNTYLALVQSDSAISHFEAAYQIRRTVYAEQAPEMIEALYYLAIAQRGQARFGEAEQSMEKAIKILRLPQNKGNVYLSHCLDLLAILKIVNTGDLEGAEPLLIESLDMSRLSYGENSLPHATAIWKQGWLALKMGKLDKAESHFNHSLRVLNTITDLRRYDYDLHTATINASLGSVCRRRGDLQQARRYLESSLRVQTERYGEDDSRQASIQFEFGKFLNATGEADSAEAVLQKSLVHYTTWPDSAFTPAQIRVELAKSLAMQGRRHEAVLLLRKSLARLSKAPGGMPEYVQAISDARDLLDKIDEQEQR